MNRCKSWGVKQTDGKQIDAFDMSCWRRALLILWITRKMNKWVQEKIIG